MKKKLKLKQLKLKKPSLHSIRPKKSVEDKYSDALKTVPSITDDTVSKHREDVLSGARKYIYPLKHSSHHIVRISIGILLLVIVAFIVICSIFLYGLQTTNGFFYDVTKVIPFPVAKVDGKYVSYESYLFELRRNLHYYQTQQQANFSTTAGKAQLKHLKTQSLSEAENNAVIAKIAAQNNVNVSSVEVNKELNLVKSENRLGESNQVFDQVLSQYFGWSESDFKRELKYQLTSQAVAAKLDTKANNTAKYVLSLAKNGTNFDDLAKKYSQDQQTSTNGGHYPNAITLNDPQIPPDITSVLFSMNPNDISNIINSGYRLEILKLNDKTAGSVHAQHIQINVNNINTYLNPVLKQNKPSKYISI